MWNSTGNKFVRSKTGFSCQSGTDYTTGQVAKLLRVAPRTVSKWFDAGMFPGSYRFPVVPGHKNGEGDRRIPQAGLMAFCRARNYPVPTDYLWLACGLRWPILAEMENLQAGSLLHYGCVGAGTMLEVGFRLADGPYAAVLIDSAEYGLGASRDLCSLVRQNYPPGTVIALILTEDVDAKNASLDFVSKGAGELNLIFGSNVTAGQLVSAVLDKLRQGANTCLPGRNGTASVALNSVPASCGSSETCTARGT